MNNKILEHSALKMLLAAMITVAFGSAALARQAEYGYALIVQQSPIDAGLVTPNVGVHRPRLNQTVVIQATPRQGYRFVYWMGDVLNPTSNRTSVVLDSPKLVIAVFEKETFELLTRSNISANGGAGTSTRTGPSLGSGSVWAALPYYEQPDYVPDIYEPPRRPIASPGGTDILVPGGDDELPVPGPDDPVPEPATMAMLAAGAMFLRKRKQRRIQ
jgi:hypothetical protein